MKVVGAKQADKGIASPISNSKNLVNLGKQHTLALEQSQSLKNSGKIITQVSKTHLNQLSQEIKQQESELKAKGYSS